MATKTIKKVTKPVEINLSDMTAAELVAKISDLSGKIGMIRLEIGAGKNKNTRQVFHMRKEIARAKTILNAKKIV